MELNKLFEAKKAITIIGVLPIESEIIGNSKEIVSLFFNDSDFKMSIFHESDNELFVRSLYLDSRSSTNRTSFRELQNKVSRIKRLKKDFLSSEIDKNSKIEVEKKNTLIWTNEDKESNKSVKKEENLIIRQLNFKQTLNIIKIDDKIYTSEIFLDIASIEDYQLVENENKIDNLNKYIQFISDEKQGGIYLSVDGEELIEMYDKEDVPRGIFPRKAFYSTNFQRYSVWVFVFNRKGQLMLHQRADKKYAKDNAGLWDKSAGGHVDISDRSSNEAAEREIIEEMYMADAEYTKYLKGDTQSLINLGEWRPMERGEEQSLNLFTRMKDEGWGYFSLKPCVKRISKRRFITAKEKGQEPKFRYSKTHEGKFDYISRQENPDYKINFKDTNFISDIFFFIAPSEDLKDEKSLKDIPSKAAKDRTLIEIRDLLDWIDEEKEEGNAEDVFTDDLLYIASQYKDTLLSFTDYIKFFFKKM